MGGAVRCSNPNGPVITIAGCHEAGLGDSGILRAADPAFWRCKELLVPRATTRLTLLDD
jgi:hypothetical protein